MREDEIISMQKKYAGLWHIEDPYDKAIETAKFTRMCIVLRDDEFTRGFLECSKLIEKALIDLKALERERMI